MAEKRGFLYVGTWYNVRELPAVKEPQRRHTSRRRIVVHVYQFKHDGQGSETRSFLFFFFLQLMILDGPLKRTIVSYCTLRHPRHPPPFYRKGEERGVLCEAKPIEEEVKPSRSTAKHWVSNSRRQRLDGLRVGSDELARLGIRIFRQPKVKLRVAASKRRETFVAKSNRIELDC